MTTAPPPLNPPLAVAARKPTWRFVFSHPAHAIALGFGSGLAPKAPGTVGTLWAWLVYALLQPHLSETQWAWLIGASLLIGWWACTVAAQHLGLADPSPVVWDEVVAFWLVLWLVTPASFGAQTVAFVLFRVFDVWKPWPIRQVDHRLHGGLGIMLDDVLAAVYAVMAVKGLQVALAFAGVLLL